MKEIVVLTVLITLVMSCKTNQEKLVYPETKKNDHTDNYHGTVVADPYRWLEDDNSEETKAWVQEQNRITFGYLEQIPFREQLRERLTELWDYPKMGSPTKRRGIYFYSYNSGLQNQSVVYMMKDLKEKGQVFLDPNLFSDDGTVSLTAFSVSNDAKYAGYGISRAGSDWQEFFIRDIESGEDLKDHLKWIKFSGMSWYRDGFFYSRYPEPKEGDKLTGTNRDQKVYYHSVGTPQSEDELVYEDPDFPLRGYNVNVTDDEQYAIITSTESTSGNAIGFKKMTETGFKWLVNSFEKDYNDIGNKDNILYVVTNQDAPRYRLIAIDMDRPEPENWTDLIPESEYVLESCSYIGGRLIASYLKDAYDIVKVYDTEGTFLHDIEFPGIGSVGGFSGDVNDEITFYTFTSFNYPPVIFKYNIADNTSEVFYESEIDFDGGQYETKQVFYESKDGTRVPMFIVHKKGIKLNGRNPTLLYGYGGFNVTYKPSFSSSRIAWLEQGSVYALANIRGGGEYGEAWHKAGTVLNKQNVFNDFIAALQEKYKGDNPVIIRIETDAGHGSGKPTSKQIEEIADQFAFYWHNMNFEPKF